MNLKKYLDKAAKRGRSEKDKSWLIRVAKLLITFWNESQQALELHDYAAREYGEHHLSIYGLISGMIVISVSLLLFL